MNNCLPYTWGVDSIDISPVSVSSSLSKAEPDEGVQVIKAYAPMETPRAWGEWAGKVGGPLELLEVVAGGEGGLGMFTNNSSTALLPDTDRKWMDSLMDQLLDWECKYYNQPNRNC